VHSYRRVSIRAVAVQINLDKETVRQILSDDLCMKKVRQKWYSGAFLCSDPSRQLSAF
jgi:hypothetical protein